MNFNSAFCHLAEKTCGEQQHLVSIVNKLLTTQAIYLLGITQTSRRTGSIFNITSATATSASHFFLLVIVSKEHTASLNVVQDKIENNLQHFIPSTAIVLCYDTFINWIENGHRFALQVISHAKLLWQHENFILPTAPANTNTDNKSNDESIYKLAINKMQSFLAGADLFRIRQEYKLSAFMLHQAAEHALSAMLVIHTGLRIGTHNIDKLLRCCSMFNDKLQDIFPRNTERSKHLFSLLNKAYIEARYKDDYSISAEDLHQLSEKVNMINALLEESKSRMLNTAISSTGRNNAV